jgi:putative ABC transport system ATP-binding protein
MLELDDVYKHYVSPGEEVRAVDGVSVKVTAGDFVAILGPSGSGKSTLLSLAGGLLTPDSGTVRFEGKNLAALRKREMLSYRREKIGLVFQGLNLITGMTAEENVALPLLLRQAPHREAHERARQALDDVGMLHRSAHTPAELSGGEQQRVAVAHALVGQPKLVLADEPTGSLDSEAGDAVLKLLSGLTRERGVATILATHDAQAAGYADRFMQMRDGRLVQANARDGGREP